MVGFCEEALKSKGILILNDGFSGDLGLWCHEVKISQILLNLINNAKDAIVESGVEEKWIRIEAHDLIDTIQISVLDSGPGIPKEIRGKIMESFFTTKATGKGTGLGLSLVKRFIDDHNGKIFLDEPREYNCFTFEVPKNLMDTMSAIAN